MPLIAPKLPFRSPIWLPDKHSQSIYPSLFRKVEFKEGLRERVTLADGDFIDVDWYLHGKVGDRPILILSHGLEGNSTRQYMLGMAKIAFQNEFDVLAWNYRSCSGEMNKARRFYHSGATDDLEAMVQLVIQRGATAIYLAGFSLGGNLTLKWLGEKGENPPQGIRKAVVFSVPLHLSSGSQTLMKLGNWIYAKRFLGTLIEKVQKKIEVYPDLVDIDKFQQIKTLWDFDEVVTGPIHGFNGAEDYYQQSSSLYYLPKIQVPVLIVNAANDPFLSPACYPEQLAASLEKVYLEIPADGGHCGFYPSSYNTFLWSEIRGMQWLSEEV